MKIFEQSKTYETIKKNVPNRNWAKVIILILSGISIYISAYLVVCMQKLIDAVTNALSTKDYTAFKVTVAITLGVILFNTFLSIVQTIVQYFMERDFILNTSKFVFESYYKQDFNFPKKEENESGIVASKLSTETQSIADWLRNGALNIFEDIIGMIIKFGMLFKYSPMLSGLCATFVIIAFAITRKLNQKLAYINKQIYAAESELVQFFTQANKSFVDIKQMGKEEQSVSKMLDILRDRIYSNKKKYMYMYMLYSSIFSFSSVIFPMAVLIIGLYLAMKGKYSIGEILAMYQLVKMAQDPLGQLAGDISSWKNTMIMTQRLDCFMPPEDEDDSKKIELEKIDKINFNCQKFSYENGKDILNNINFEINSGDIFCIKGKTGIGKSTIISLLMRFNKLESPSMITINGINILDYTHKSFYKNIQFLNQMPYIFEDSLINNISMGNQYSEDELKEVIKTTQLESFVDEYGYDYILKEDANNISGGQKQRIGLARMLIRKPQMLILDEPTSALDEKTSINIVNNLKTFIKKYGMTLVVISHSSVFDNEATNILDLNTLSN